MTEATFGAGYPLRTFRFVVQFSDDKPAYFQAVSGLDGEVTSSTEYRRDQGEHARKVPSHSGFGKVILHRGILANGSQLLRWCEHPTTGSVGPSTITIQLLNESGAVTVTWTLVNAAPIRVTGLMDGTDGERPVDAIELKFESVTISSTNS